VAIAAAAATTTAGFAALSTATGEEGLDGALRTGSVAFFATAAAAGFFSDGEAGFFSTVSFGREREVLVERRVEVLHSAGGREVGFLGVVGLLRGHCEVEMLGLWWDWVFVFR
jgi:hypothetical protein